MAKVFTFDFQDFEARDPEFARYKELRQQGSYRPTAAYQPGPVLFEPEVIRVSQVALKLAHFHNQRETDLPECVLNIRRTTAGLLAEYAALKYFKLHLGYIGDLKFNEVYVNGGDGGHDFSTAGILWDVKYSADGAGIPASFIKDASKAHFYLLVTRGKDRPPVKGARPYNIIGFLPASHVRDSREEFLSWRSFTPIVRLARGLQEKWPLDFIGPVKYGPPVSAPYRVGELLGGVTSDLLESWLQPMEKAIA